MLPARNEAAALPGLIRELRRCAALVVVVDDASTDGTAAVAREAGAEVISHSWRKGKTAAIRSALPRARGAEWILFMDADGQHDPADIARLWELRSDAGAVLGVRDLRSPRMPLLRRWANRAMSKILNALTGGTLSDTQCGFRLVRSHMLADWEPCGREYEWETELYGRLCRSGATLIAAPVATLYGQERSGIFWPRETWRFVCACMRILRERQRTKEFLPPTPTSAAVGWDVRSTEA